VNGTDILVLVSGTAVGSQRDCSFDESNEEIDMSSKDSRAYRVIAGRYKASLSLDALYVPDDASYQALKTALRDGSLIQVNREEDGTTLETADAIVTKLSEKGPDQGPATVSISLTIDNGWTAGAGGS